MIKLNLGCGRDYKPGFVNIDFYDKTVCDKTAPITHLGYSENSVDLIEANQLLEHIGYVQSIYALSEWFFILKPGGHLVIETPDIAKSFRKYLQTKSLKARKEVLNWIFGHETPGYNHVFCYDFACLNELLVKIGFANIKLEQQRTHLYEPGMRVNCMKPRNCELHQSFATIRKKVLPEFQIVLGNQVFAMELESVLDAAFKLFRKKNKRGQEEAFMLLCNYSPSLAEIIFGVLEAKKLIKRRSYSSLARGLIGERFIQRKYSALVKINSFSVNQSASLKILDTFSNGYLKSTLAGKKLGVSTNYLSKTKIKEDFKTLSVFSLEHINDLAEADYYKAKKYFSQGHKIRSIKFFKKAFSLNADIKGYPLK